MTNNILRLFLSLLVIFIVIRMANPIEKKINEPLGGGWKTDCLVIISMIFSAIAGVIAIVSLYNILNYMFFS